MSPNDNKSESDTNHSSSSSIDIQIALPDDNSHTGSSSKGRSTKWQAKKAQDQQSLKLPSEVLSHLSGSVGRALASPHPLYIPQAIEELTNLVDTYNLTRHLTHIWQMRDTLGRIIRGFHASRSGNSSIVDTITYSARASPLTHIDEKRRLFGFDVTVQADDLGVVRELETELLKVVDAFNAKHAAGGDSVTNMQIS